VQQLQEQIERLESEKHSLQEANAKSQSRILSLSDKIEEQARKDAEFGRLQDQVEEFGLLADKLQKTEALVEKWKKKAAALEDQLDQHLLTEERMAQVASENSLLQEQMQKLEGYKPLLDSYKLQISSLEERVGELHVSSTGLETSLGTAKGVVGTLDEERQRDLEKLMDLQDTIKDYELGLVQQVDYFDDNLVQEIKALRQERLELMGKLDRIGKLEQELHEVTELKTKFQADYESVYTSNLHLHNELERFKAVPDQQAIELFVNRSLLTAATQGAGSASVKDPATLEKLKLVQGEHREAQQRCEQLEIANAELEHKLADVTSRHEACEKTIG
ncbi:hypothetical protein HDU91_004248, partial [Kappamyces sp. JEL0680]